MKRLILLLAMLLTSVSCLADSIEGDTNHDGLLSGSEQYLLDNPTIEGATPERVRRVIQKERQRQEQVALWEEQDALDARKAQQKATYQRYMDNQRSMTSVYEDGRWRTYQRVYYPNGKDAVLIPQ
jgi:hypothetical protein